MSSAHGVTQQKHLTLPLGTYSVVFLLFSRGPVLGVGCWHRWASNTLSARRTPLTRLCIRFYASISCIMYADTHYLLYVLDATLVPLGCSLLPTCGLLMTVLQAKRH